MTPRGMRASEVRLRPARGALSCGCADRRGQVAAGAGRISLRSATAATWPRPSAFRSCALRRPRPSLAQPSVPSRRRALARGGSSGRRLLPDRTHPRRITPASGWRAGVVEWIRKMATPASARGSLPPGRSHTAAGTIEKVGASAAPGRAGRSRDVRARPDRLRFATERRVRGLVPVQPFDGWRRRRFVEVWLGLMALTLRRFDGVPSHRRCPRCATWRRRGPERVNDFETSGGLI